MLRRALLLCSIGLLAFDRAGAAQPFGDAPVFGAGARDLAASYPLPQLHDAPGGDIASMVGRSQVGKRARRLGLDAGSAFSAWRAADASLVDAEARLQATAPAVQRRFTGRRASELNAVLRDPAVSSVRVESKRLDVDEPVLVRRSHLWLDLGQAELRAAPGGPRFLVRIENASDVTLVGGRFVQGRWGALVSRSQAVTLRHGVFSRLSNGGIVLTHARGAVIGRAVLTKLGGAGVLVHGMSEGTVILRNEVVANLGSSNWSAGIVVTDRIADVAEEPLKLLQPDRYGVVEQAIDSRLSGPRGTVVAFNRVAWNAASGIYSDGGIQSVVFDNDIEGNSKEGVCLDNGSTANVVAMNRVQLNGKRWGKTDAELRLDFVEKAGRLPDGTSASKTPGISLDNALYNTVYANQIDHNFGGGVKMVRTAFFNLIGLNTLIDNNEGASPHFHFFGIELGAAPGDVPVVDLDFLPSRGNLVFANGMYGKHYAGIFYAAGSSDNDSFDNSIFGATAWALEQVTPQANRSLNNLTNLRSRNIGNGLGPSLGK